ncbi:BREX system Lon protease-like protein BrxL [Clostridium estertheticum]|uniref:BREX system Lon protease-like protein BrxL n=1 Tax=Clostridium estertheticum TaxID=238834 RepID=UPI0013E99737|nr:BREX system Lon protease-like protein BrxL [Clostridium estertheticum]MBZ9688456.1 BREX system Lon protease-like protein BrxL [Clostridium estertheticum]
MLKFEELAYDYYGDVVINKNLIHKAGFASRAIPTYVGEWILYNFLEDGELTEESREKISAFVNKYLPQKGQKEEIKNRLLNMESVKLLDDYSVVVNLKSGKRVLKIPFLDMNDAFISDEIVDKNTLLLTSGVWGVADLFYIPPSAPNDKGQVWMREFKPFQVGSIDLEYFKECRANFSTEEWIDLILSSMGFNPTIYNEEQKNVLITRILPMVEPRVNLIELAPKGTGKSFVYGNVSRYARVIGGGKVSPAVMFHHNGNNTPGLVTRYDLVVLDEVQSIQGDSTGELVAGLKVYLESGRFSRGNTEASAEAGFVMLGNITLDENLKPVHSEEGIFTEIPNFLQETAFIDRLHGIIPGWLMPRISKDTPSNNLGFKGDFFSEILHNLRGEPQYTDYVNLNMNLNNCNDLRDRKAIVRLAAAYLKIIFPDLIVENEEFIKYCVKPAVTLRQSVRDELYKMDREYAKVNIGVLE